MAVLTHPLARGLDPDGADVLVAHRAIVRAKPFLRRVYEDWYRGIEAAIPDGGGRVLEVGSGGGFLSERIPDLITSEIVVVPPACIALDATALPFSAGSLKAIAMTNVLHHVRDPRAFFSDAARAVRPGGVIVMVEPWVSTWSRFVYRYLHHEPFAPDTTTWELPPAGRLSGANGALPWIMFKRDRHTFTREFPMWRIEEVRPCMPLLYLVSGGITRARFSPGLAFPFWRGLERVLSPVMSRVAMFAIIRLRRLEL